MVDDDPKVARVSFDYALSIVGRHLVQSMQWSHGLPGMFLKLFETGDGEVYDILTRLGDLWELVAEGERLAERDPWVRARMKDRPVRNASL